jgi:hypothetical protein
MSAQQIPPPPPPPVSGRPGVPGPPTQTAPTRPTKAESLHVGLVKRAQPLLPPGTRIRQIFLAGTLSPKATAVLCITIIGAPVAMLINHQRMIAVADDAIYVLKCGRLTPTKPTRVLRTLPRTTRFELAGGTMAWHITVPPEKLWVTGAVSRAEIAGGDADAPKLASPPPPGAPR